MVYGDGFPERVHRTLASPPTPSGEGGVDGRTPSPTLGAQGKRSLTEYWKYVSSERWFQAHPAMAGKTIDQLDTTLPLYFHLDGVEVYRNTEFLIWTWSSAVADCLNVWDSRFVYALLPAMFMTVRDVFVKANDEITRLIGWDLLQCEIGIAPTKGFYGEDFAGSCSRSRIQGRPLTFKSVFAGVKADGKAYRDMHLFTRHYGCTWFCQAIFVGTFRPPPRLAQRLLALKANPRSKRGFCRDGSVGLKLRATDLLADRGAHGSRIVGRLNRSRRLRPQVANIDAWASARFSQTSTAYLHALRFGFSRASANIRTLPLDAGMHAYLAEDRLNPAGVPNGTLPRQCS